MSLIMGMVLCVGMFCIYDGFKRGYLYGRLVNGPSEELTITRVYNRVNRRVFPDYRAQGLINGEAQLVEVSIFQEEFRKLTAGDALEVYRVSEARRLKWVTASKVEESKPIFHVFGISFSWHFPAGVLLTLAAVAHFRRKKSKRTSSAAAVASKDR